MKDKYCFVSKIRLTVVSVLSISMMALLFACNQSPTMTEMNERNENLASTSQSIIDQVDLKALYDAIQAEYEEKGLSQVSVFAPKDQDYLNLEIKLSDTTLFKKTYINSENEKLKLERGTSHNKSSDCEEVVIGYVYSEHSVQIGEIETTICEQQSSGYVSEMFNLGSNLIYSADFNSNTVQFPNVTFNLQWESNTSFWSYTMTFPEFQSDISFSLSTSTTLNSQGQTYGADYVDLSWVKLVKNEVPVIPPAPALQSPTENEISYSRVDFEWQSVSASPTPISYELRIDDQSSSFTKSETTTNTSLEVDLPDDRTYTWRVRAKNANNDFGPWSSSRTLNVLPNVHVRLVKDYNYNESFDERATSPSGTGYYMDVLDVTVEFYSDPNFNNPKTLDLPIELRYQFDYSESGTNPVGPGAGNPCQSGNRTDVIPVNESSYYLDKDIIYGYDEMMNPYYYCSGTISLREGVGYVF